MRVLICGATGMVGQGVLRECLADQRIAHVTILGRTRATSTNAKLTQIIGPDWTDEEAIARVGTVDACFYCLGVSSAGMDEARYKAITYDLTLKVVRALLKNSPNLTLIYVSGAGTDSTGKGRIMWARVKGKLENDLYAMPLKAFMFRPGFIEPRHGIRSKTRLYRLLYALAPPFLIVARAIVPKHILTTEQVGRAMINLAIKGGPKHIFEAPDIYELAA